MFEKGMQVKKGKGASSPERLGFDRRMSRDEINACPLEQYNGPVHVVRSGKQLAEAVKVLAEDPVLGFDTETRPAFKKGQSYPPALIQLAADKAVYIFQLHHLGFAKELRDIFKNPNIVKAGVALDYDLQELQKLAAFQPGGFVDMGKAAKDASIKNHGLRGLAAVLLGFRISKGAQQSNWANDTLTPRQITYAATDAWVGRELYLCWQRNKGAACWQPAPEGP